MLWLRDVIWYIYINDMNIYRTHTIQQSNLAAWTTPAFFDWRRWKIPKLNGGFSGKIIIELNGILNGGFPIATLRGRWWSVRRTCPKHPKATCQVSELRNAHPTRCHAWIHPIWWISIRVLPPKSHIPSRLNSPGLTPMINFKYEVTKESIWFRKCSAQFGHIIDYEIADSVPACPRKMSTWQTKDDEWARWRLIGGLEHLLCFHSVGNVIIPTVTHSYFSEG
jgi:hypothetical protein